MANTQRILITGTSSGFGLGAAKALAAKGHKVFATMRAVEGKNAKKAEELRDFAKQSGHSLTVLELDVTRDDSVAKAISAVVESSGSLDILINNAGVGTWGVQEAFTPEQVRDVFEVNVFGMLRVNRAVLPLLRKQGSGYVIYVSSGLGRIQFPFLGPYTASKHAVEAIAESGSYELKPLGIDTTILQPGAFGTGFLGNSVFPKDAARVEEQPPVKAMFQAFSSSFEERARSGHLGNPEEVFAALVELVDMPKNARPLRKVVGEDVKAAVTPINELCAQIQNQLLTSMGIR